MVVFVNRYRCFFLNSCVSTCVYADLGIAGVSLVWCKSAYRPRDFARAQPSVTVEINGNRQDVIEISLVADKKNRTRLAGCVCHLINARGRTAVYGPRSIHPFLCL